MSSTWFFEVIYDRDTEKKLCFLAPVILTCFSSQMYNIAFGHYLALNKERTTFSLDCIELAKKGLLK